MEEKKHFAFYIASLQRAGAERVMANLASYLYERGHRVTIVTTYLGLYEYDVKYAAWKILSKEEAEAAGNRAQRVMYTDETIGYVDMQGGYQDDSGRGGVRRIFSGLLPEEQKQFRAANLAKRSNLLRKIWEELRPDLILSFIGKNNIMALMTTIGLQTPVVVSVRNNPADEYATRQLHLSMISTFPRASGVVIQQKPFENYFPPNIKERTKVIPNPIDESFLRPRYEGQRDKTIVAVGTLNKRKNHAMLLKAFARLKSTHPEWNIVIYGEGSEHKSLVSLINALGLRGCVELAGQVNDVADRIYKAGCFVMCSNAEGMPNALMEAMALGLPCITTDFAGGAAKELVKDGFSGLVVPTADVARLEKALLRILDNPGFAETLGKKAAEIQSKYAPDVVHAMWETYFETILTPEEAEQTGNAS